MNNANLLVIILRIDSLSLTSMSAAVAVVWTRYKEITLKSGPDFYFWPASSAKDTFRKPVHEVILRRN